MLIWGLCLFFISLPIFFPISGRETCAYFYHQKMAMLTDSQKYEEFLLLQIPQAQTKVIHLELILSEQALFHAGPGCSLSIKWQEVNCSSFNI